MATQVNGREVDYSTLPDHMQDGMRRYLEFGVLPGSFGLAVLCNDLTQAYARADSENAAAMHAWASWLWNECPRAAWGSFEKVKRWSLDRELEEAEAARVHEEETQGGTL